MATRAPSARTFSLLTPTEQQRAIHEALEQAGGHRGQAAKLLGISRASFYRYFSQGADKA
jgi:transcriptional regulator with PAS, ATPase and Fis domain